MTLLRGKMVEIFSNNSASVACVNLQGSRTAWLNAAASKLWEFCLSKKISLRATHIPGESNIEADALSRWLIDDPLGYQLNPAIFVKIDAQLGPLLVDLFASSVNRLLPRFYSWLFDPEVEAVDAMRQDWPLGAYAHPPLKLLERFALLSSRARGSVILIAPTWPSAPWWPLLLKHETIWALWACRSSFPAATLCRPRGGSGRSYRHGPYPRRNKAALRSIRRSGGHADG